MASVNKAIRPCRGRQRGCSMSAPKATEAALRERLLASLAVAAPAALAAAERR